MNRVYHVAKTGDDFYGLGTPEQPFLTIQRAAEVAELTDTVIVHEGVYREWVKPRHSGYDNFKRITYMAAEGETVVIKGSEVVTGWVKEGNVWKAEVPNAMFGDYNPYSYLLDGDWFIEVKEGETKYTPDERPIHTGEVFFGGKAYHEEPTLEEAKAKEETWYAEVGADVTTIYANFTGDPNETETEITVRKCCFYPERTGINYITVRGFEMAQAATPWVPPTADQPGMLGPHWAKGWIIENNHLHDSKCAAISLGKENTTGHNLYTKRHLKAGYQYQLETVFRAKAIGWDKEKIGSHIVRNNYIHDCGQNGIVGHMGCAFSEVYGNEIFNIGTRHEWFGFEICAIKFHAAIDTQIHHNNIHHSAMGTWLDWQAQGTRLSHNVYHHNEMDLWIEVTHGPYVVDNNIIGSDYTIINAAQGGAYVHNLFNGCLSRYDVRDRSTPYHYNHSTDIAGCACVYGFDDRLIQNIFAGDLSLEKPGWESGTHLYNGCPTSIDEYVDRVMEGGRGDIEKFLPVPQPAYVKGNAYLNGAKAFEKETEKFVDANNPKIEITQEDGKVYLTMDIPEGMLALNTETVRSKNLGVPRITELPYENPDGSEMIISDDLLGKARGEHPVSGPIEATKSGRQTFLVWERK